MKKQQNSAIPSFKREQTKFIVYSAISYAFFYITRKNLSMAQPSMLEEGVISIEALGTIMTLHGLIYGLSRFLNGFWADRINGRIFMAIGLLLSALMNFLFGCSSLAILFAIFWIINGWTQGMGFPACSKMLTQWIHPKELATKMSIWNTCHSFGSILTLGICSTLLAFGFGWRWCFYIPAVLAALTGLFCIFKVKESPKEAHVPELKLEIPQLQKNKDEKQTITNADRRKLVFGNKVIWLVSFANFFLYIVRFGFLDWGPTFLKQYKGISVSKGGMMIVFFELAAIVGTIFSGWITDKVFKGRGARTCVISMALTALFAFGFWYLPAKAPMWQATLLLMGAGFCIYGPQALVGIIASNQATKEAAALATGFTGIMGYASTLVSGLGIALISKHFGWGTALCSIGIFALIGMLFFLMAWNAKASSYKE